MKLQRHTRIAFVGAAWLVVVAMLVPAMAMAEPGQGRSDVDRKAKRAKFMAKMKQHRGRMLREKVGLSEAKAQKLERIMDGFHQKRRALHQQMRSNHKALRQLLKADSNDQQAYKKSVDGLIDARDRMQKLKRQQIRAMRKHLTPKQQAKAMMALHRMKRKMHHKMRRMHRKHRGMRGSGANRRGSPEGARGGPEHEGPPPHHLGHDGPPPYYDDDE